MGFKGFEGFWFGDVVSSEIWPLVRGRTCLRELLPTRLATSKEQTGVTVFGCSSFSYVLLPKTPKPLTSYFRISRNLELKLNIHEKNFVFLNKSKSNNNLEIFSFVSLIS
jgi:hypothetical protein